MIGLPEQAQVNVPPVAVGVIVTVTSTPTEEVAVDPVTETTPVVDIDALATLPTAAIEQSAATVDGTAPALPCAASVMHDLPALAASINSETLALVV